MGSVSGLRVLLAMFGGGDDDALDGGSGTPDRCDGEGGTDTATACEQLISIP